MLSQAAHTLLDNSRAILFFINLVFPLTPSNHYEKRAVGHLLGDSDRSVQVTLQPRNPLHVLSAERCQLALFNETQ